MARLPLRGVSRSWTAAVAAGGVPGHGHAAVRLLEPGRHGALSSLPPSLPPSPSPPPPPTPTSNGDMVNGCAAMT